MEITNIGDYVVSIELDRVEGTIGGGLRYYDAVLSKDGMEVKIHKGCIGEKSGQYWGKKLENLARKLIILNSRKCMAQHNMACYCGSERYGQEYLEAKEEVEFIDSWIEALITGKVGA